MAGSSTTGGGKQTRKRTRIVLFKSRKKSRINPELMEEKRGKKQDRDTWQNHRKKKYRIDGGGREERGDTIIDYCWINGIKAE